MFEIIPIEIILLFSAFTNFWLYQELQWQEFRGSSRFFERILGLSVIIATICGFIFLVYYGIKVVWWAPFLLFLIGVLSQIITTLIEALIGKLTISLLGFIGWPVCIYFLFSFTPNL